MVREALSGTLWRRWRIRRFHERTAGEETRGEEEKERKEDVGRQEVQSHRLVVANRREGVFINVPFDRRYKKLFDALVFAVHDCGFVARGAREEDDSSQIRLEKLLDIIGDCRFGIHDLSRVTLDSKNRLPRFNMPLELGIFLGAKRFGGPRHARKSCLILDRDPYRYQIFCSDIGGQDIRPHHNDVRSAVAAVRSWLRTTGGRRGPPWVGRHGEQIRAVSLGVAGDLSGSATRR
jgi:hypothetical protein